jgi:hypothetical protein
MLALATCSVWVTLLSLGYAIAQLRLRKCSVWVTALLSFGYGSAQFGLRVLKVIDAPSFKIIDGTGAFSTASAKLLRNRRFRSSYLGHAHTDPRIVDPMVCARAPCPIDRTMQSPARGPIRPVGASASLPGQSPGPVDNRPSGGGRRPQSTAGGRSPVCLGLVCFGSLRPIRKNSPIRGNKVPKVQWQSLRSSCGS